MCVQEPELGESAAAALEGTSWEPEAGGAGVPMIILDHVTPWCTLPQ